MPDDDDEEAQRLLADFAKEDAEKNESDDEKDDLTDEERNALGDPGKQALDRTKEKWRKERESRKALEAELAKFKAPAKKEDGESDIEALREQARAEARAETLRERVLDKIESRAARLFKDPEDAVLRLGKSVDDYIDDGKIDTEAIDDALKELLGKRPDFALAQGEKEPKRFQGSADGGARDKPAGKQQLTKQDVEQLAAQGKYSEIEDARLDGRLNKLLGIA